jgi:hypothetical protein
MTRPVKIPADVPSTGHLTDLTAKITATGPEPVAGTLVTVVRCDGLGSFNRIGGTDRCLPSVHCASLGPGEVREGQVLAGTELRREEDGALPRSLSGPVCRRQTEAATAFADRHAPLLASQADIAPPGRRTRRPNVTCLQARPPIDRRLYLPRV